MGENNSKDGKQAAYVCLETFIALFLMFKNFWRLEHGTRLHQYVGYIRARQQRHSSRFFTWTRPYIPGRPADDFTAHCS